MPVYARNLQEQRRCAAFSLFLVLCHAEISCLARFDFFDLFSPAFFGNLSLSARLVPFPALPPPALPCLALQLKRLYNHLDIGVRFAGLSFNVVECSPQVSGGYMSIHGVWFGRSRRTMRSLSCRFAHRIGLSVVFGALFASSADPRTRSVYIKSDRCSYIHTSSCYLGSSDAAE